jgi:chemotaxis protein CheC
MRLDVDTLGTFYEMARQGAGLAADRLTQMTGVGSRVTNTRIEFSSPERVVTELTAADGSAGAVVDLSGGVAGQTVLLFDAGDARTVAEGLVADVDEEEVAYDDEHLIDSAVPELCGIMNNGFIDGWANVLNREVELSTPRYVSRRPAQRLVRTERTGDVALLFQSQIDTPVTATDFKHYFIPDAGTADELFSAPTGIAYKSLVGFDRVAQRGADRVTDDLSKLTGIETTVDVRRVNFIALDAIPESVPQERLASVVFRFNGVPSGYMLFLLDNQSARTLARTMTGTVPEQGLHQMGRDAVKEASNIMASGLLDGWANALDTTIQHTAPAFAWEMGPAAVDPLIVGLAEKQEFAFIFDTKVEAADESFGIDVFVIPDEADLERALDAVDPDRADQAPAAAAAELSEFDDEDLANVREVRPE